MALAVAFWIDRLTEYLPGSKFQIGTNQKTILKLLECEKATIIIRNCKITKLQPTIKPEQLLNYSHTWGILLHK